MARPLLQQPSALDLGHLLPLDLVQDNPASTIERHPSSQPSPLALDLIPSKAKGQTLEARASQPASPSPRPLDQIVHQHKRAPVYYSNIRSINGPRLCLGLRRSPRGTRSIATRG
jgi:hypothetical protein